MTRFLYVLPLYSFSSMVPTAKSESPLCTCEACTASERHALQLAKIVVVSCRFPTARENVHMCVCFSPTYFNSASFVHVPATHTAPPKLTCIISPPTFYLANLTPYLRSKREREFCYIPHHNLDLIFRTRPATELIHHHIRPLLCFAYSFIAVSCLPIGSYLVNIPQL